MHKSIELKTNIMKNKIVNKKGLPYKLYNGSTCYGPNLCVKKKKKKKPIHVVYREKIKNKKWRGRLLDTITCWILLLLYIIYFFSFFMWNIKTA